ncbi:barstar family protein [Propionivibrio sp.]|uniref:barstar family protein n=1 Tax=Propionivibrio sp. TaxID=2212460 RepID=UPI0025CC1393|nr:barstar family protein [Propionivibrio sp.]
MTVQRNPDPTNEKQMNNSAAGIFRLARKDLPALRQAADELKQHVFSVDLEHAHNVPGFIKALSRDLDFPEWFGGNLDALHDCLTDFSWHPAPGYIITLGGSETLRANPTSFAAFNQVLASAVQAWQARNIPFRVFYLHDDPNPASGQDLSSGKS